MLLGSFLGSMILDYEYSLYVRTPMAANIFQEGGPCDTAQNKQMDGKHITAQSKETPITSGK